MLIEYFANIEKYSGVELFTVEEFTIQVSKFTDYLH